VRERDVLLPGGRTLHAYATEGDDAASGGPHALACAALLGDRVSAALAWVATRA
jgi:hypothetical protein